MTDNVEVLDTPYREYAEDRDWLVPETGLRPSATIIPFSPKMLLCSICSSRHHRASSCPSRPRPARASCGND